MESITQKIMGNRANIDPIDIYKKKETSKKLNRGKSTTLSNKLACAFGCGFAIFHFIAGE